MNVKGMPMVEILNDQGGLESFLFPMVFTSLP